MRPPTLRLALALVLCCSCLVPLLAAVPGGFSDVSVDDARVKAAANFAIAERAKTEPTIVLDKITKASRQVVAGMNYDLTLQVKVGTETKTAKARVWAKLDQSHELSTWEYVKQ